MSTNIEIIIGTYEEFLLGYKLDVNNEKPALLQSFADKSHSGSIRCVAVHKNWVASGGTDDRIFIYDMISRKQSQILLPHEGTITSLAFTPDGTHLLSGGEDGRMIATRLKTWFIDATWKKAHNGSPVTHITCHPSGKLALSLGSDLVLRTWNLVKGRVAYKTNLKSRNTLGLLPDCLAWSTNGDYFSITGQRLIEIWSIKTADVVETHKTKSKPVCLSWITNDACLVGLEDGTLIWINIGSEEGKEIPAHNARVKSMCVFENNLVTASSSGEIKLWQIKEKKQKLKEIASANVGCRPTCIGILDLEQFGENYVLSSTLEPKENGTKTMATKKSLPQRGVVTIEYANDDDDEKEESEGHESVQENDESEAVDSTEDEVNDTDNENESEDESSDDNSDDSNHQPEIPLPKSRKHKLQIAKKQEHTNKKQKMENKSRQNLHTNQPQNTKNKSKLKVKNK